MEGKYEVGKLKCQSTYGKCYCGTHLTHILIHINFSRILNFKFCFGATEASTADIIQLKTNRIKAS